MVSPWRTAPTDAEGRTSYRLDSDKIVMNESFYRDRLDARIQAIVDAGLLPVPVLCWAHKKGDAGIDLSEAHIQQLIEYELNRYSNIPALWILAGDNNYRGDEAAKWKRIGQAVFQKFPQALLTTHPTGNNWPWDGWDEQTWLRVLSYQSGHSDDDNFANWIHHGPPSKYGVLSGARKPIINLEPPYENHFSYANKKSMDEYVVRRASYWSLLSTPIAGITYGGHGVWSWHTAPGQTPTDHPGTGVAKVWRDAMQLPGAQQIGYARKFFESLPWTELRPAPEWIEQPNDPSRYVTCAATSDGKFIVAYFPRESNAFKWTKIESLRDAKIQWFDPITGLYRPGTLDIPSKSQDWLIVLHRP